VAASPKLEPASCLPATFLKLISVCRLIQMKKRSRVTYGKIELSLDGSLSVNELSSVSPETIPAVPGDVVGFRPEC
jgi:hypothetical protein